MTEPNSRDFDPHTAAPAVSDEDARSPDFPPYIWIGPLSDRFPTQRLCGKIWFAFCAVIIFFATLNVVSVAFMGISAGFAACMFIGCFLMAVIMIPVNIYRSGGRIVGFPFQIEFRDPHVQSQAQRLLDAHQFDRIRAALRNFRPSTVQLRREIEEWIGEPKRCFADETLRGELERISLEEPMREPESVGSDVSPSTVTAALVMILMLIFVVDNVSHGDWLTASLLLVCIVFFAFSLPSVRKRVGSWQLWEVNQPILGEGAVMNQKGKRWTINDSLLLVRRNAGDKRIYATFVGREGCLEFFYHTTEDENFRLLWQQWNAPNARPELMD